jgi:hypothetical protein
MELGAVGCMDHERRFVPRQWAARARREVLWVDECHSPAGTEDERDVSKLSKVSTIRNVVIP